jgi:hypothetical protein
MKEQQRENQIKKVSSLLPETHAIEFRHHQVVWMFCAESVMEIPL